MSVEGSDDSGGRESARGPRRGYLSILHFIRELIISLHSRPARLPQFVSSEGVNTEPAT